VRVKKEKKKGGTGAYGENVFLKFFFYYYFVESKKNQRKGKAHNKRMNSHAGKREGREKKFFAFLSKCHERHPPML
jgi:hypothetical protein